MYIQTSPVEHLLLRKNPRHSRKSHRTVQTPTSTARIDDVQEGIQYSSLTMINNDYLSPHTFCNPHINSSSESHRSTSIPHAGLYPSPSVKYTAPFETMSAGRTHHEISRDNTIYRTYKMKNGIQMIRSGKTTHIC